MLKAERIERMRKEARGKERKKEGEAGREER